MATPEQWAIGKLDGRNPDLPNYPPEPWTNVDLYAAWDFGEDWVDREAGSNPGKKPGETWSTPSQIDQGTALAEILTKKYCDKDRTPDVQVTVLHMISAIYAVLIEGREVDEVRNRLGYR